MRLWVRAFAVAVCLAPAVAWAGGATALTASHVRVGGGWIQDTLQQGTPTWYTFAVIPGRSYCVETQAGDDNSDLGDTRIDVFKADGTTPVASGDEDVLDKIPFEASGFQFSRACMTPGVGDASLVFSLQNNLGGTVVRRFRVVETTMWCPWFFDAAGSYTAFVLIKNTTVNAFAITVTAYDPAGSVLASATGTIDPHGSLNYALTSPPFSLANQAGTLTIARAAVQPAGTPDGVGGPGSLVANATTINFTAGVSFDTPFAPRLDWQQ